MDDITTAIDVDAPAETVWEVLTDFERYGEWNPQLRITGRAAKGERLRVEPGPAAEGMPTFRPRVLRADGPAGDEAGELRWLGHLLLPGLFDGEHGFRVEPLADGRSRLTQSESFRGILAGPIGRRYGERTREGFERMNRALGARAESRFDAGIDGNRSRTAV